jgi:hypothetical protein
MSDLQAHCLDLFQDSDLDRYTKRVHTITQTRITPCDLPQDLISFKVSFQERPIRLPQKKFVHQIERFNKPRNMTLQLPRHLVSRVPHFPLTEIKNISTPLGQAQTRHPIHIDAL